MTKKITIDLKRFLLTGAFDCLKLAQSQDWIRKNFVKPDKKYIDEQSKISIWSYGAVELHFKDNVLFMIYSDAWFDKFLNGKNVKYKKWIFKNISKLTLSHVLSVLNTEKLNYLVKFDKKLNSITIDITQSNVKLFFKEFENDEFEPNSYKMSAFWLKDNCD